MNGHKIKHAERCGCARCQYLPTEHTLEDVGFTLDGVKHKAETIDFNPLSFRWQINYYVVINGMCRFKTCDQYEWANMAHTANLQAQTAGTQRQPASEGDA